MEEQVYSLSNHPCWGNYINIEHSVLKSLDNNLYYNSFSEIINFNEGLKIKPVTAKTINYVYSPLQVLMWSSELNSRLLALLKNDLFKDYHHSETVSMIQNRGRCTKHHKAL